MRLPAALKRKLAEWAFRHLEPQLGEWRQVRGTHWRLDSINLTMSMCEGSALELRYVEVAPRIDWNTIVPGSELLPGEWREV